MVLRLGALIVLTDDPGSFPRAPMATHNYL